MSSFLKTKALGLITGDANFGSRSVGNEIKSLVQDRTVVVLWSLRVASTPV